MGDDAEDILASFNLSEDDAKKYGTVETKFNDHFNPRKNVIFERAKFNSRKQEEGEPVDAFITTLYKLSEHCNYGDLRNEMIRDRNSSRNSRCAALRKATTRSQTHPGRRCYSSTSVRTSQTAADCSQRN